MKKVLTQNRYDDIIRLWLRSREAVAEMSRAATAENQTIKNVIGNMIKNTNATMTKCGYFEGVLKTMWAEMALEVATEGQAAQVYWDMRKLIGWEAN
jgi:hypothetical protein